MHVITRSFGFDAGHRVLRHESKCAHLHGHRYTAEVSVCCDDLDDLGRVIDFGQVKEIIGGWIDRNWDHNMILHPDDPLIDAMKRLEVLEPDPQGEGVTCWSEMVYANKPPYVMPGLQNPTAENLARLLLDQCRLLICAPLQVVRVKLYETPNCWAEVSECPVVLPKPLAPRDAGITNV